MTALKKVLSCWLVPPKASLAVGGVGGKKSLLCFFLTTLLLATSCLLLSSSPALAADPSPSPAPKFEPLSSSNYNNQIHSQVTVDTLLNDAMILGVGKNIFGQPFYVNQFSITEKGITMTPGVTTQETGGALGMAGGMLASIYKSPPTSSIQYLASVGENMGIIPKNVYAQSVQGAGESIIHPVLTLWQVMRNISYLFFILVFIAVGLMIMLRQKLNPQTVIGVQQALPGLIIGLILVTFSYFIAALVVDLTFVGTRIVAEVFVQAANNRPDFNIYNPETSYKQSNLFNLFGTAGFAYGDNVGTLNKSILDTFNTGGDGLSHVLSALMGGIAGGLVGLAFGGPLGAFLVGLGGATLGGVTGVGGKESAAGIASLIIPLILMIALMIQFFKLLFSLIGSYIQILVLTIFGPVLILVSSIPGKGGALSYWLKGLVANALVFPAVFAAFMFAGVILGNNGADWGTTSVPLFGGMSTELLRFLIAFGILLGTPAIPEMVRNAFGVKGPQGFTQAAMGGFMGGVGVAKTGYGAATSDLKRAKEEAMKTRAATRAGAGGARKWWHSIV